jgi:hypothetical protein
MGCGAPAPLLPDKAKPPKSRGRGNYAVGHRIPGASAKAADTIRYFCRSASVLEYSHGYSFGSS